MRQVIIEYIEDNIDDVASTMLNSAEKIDNPRAAFMAVLCATLQRGIIMGVHMGKTVYLEEAVGD